MIPYAERTFPRWRHHPEKESMIVYDWGVEESQTPDEDGWRDDRNFDAPEPPKNKGGRPRKAEQ